MAHKYKRESENYSWTSQSGLETVNEPIDIASFPSIKVLMAKINTGLNVELNSCLVTKFDSGRAGLRLHDDNEDEMDSGSPICVFTLGNERTVDFLGRYIRLLLKPQLLLSHPRRAVCML